MIHQGDCLDILKSLDAESVHSLVTDPPAGISFMGKEWDSDKGGSKEWIAWMSEVMRECLRVLKPGAHALVWAIPRTSHWTATALEDAGFEIRDVITHIFGSGFPKSMNISIAIDKQAGAMKARGRALVSAGKGDREDLQDNKGNWTEPNEHKAITPEAKLWQGFGTALKPASEHWILCRKPLSEKTVSANVLKHGTGGINIDGCRIGTELVENGRAGRKSNAGGVMEAGMKPIGFEPKTGRFPANLLFSHNDDCDDACTDGCAVKMLDAQSAATGASRFFYCAKVSKSERNAGCEGLPEKSRFDNSEGCDLAEGKVREKFTTAAAANHHPTVKPLKLMRYLIRLVTPPGGTVLDPFMGSGSTGVAALREGFQFIGIEREPEYIEISERRIAHQLEVSQ